MLLVELNLYYSFRDISKRSGENGIRTELLTSRYYISTCQTTVQVKLSTERCFDSLYLLKRSEGVRKMLTGSIVDDCLARLKFYDPCILFLQGYYRVANH